MIFLIKKGKVKDIVGGMDRMLFLREFCQTSSVLKVILFIQELLNIIRFIVPIGLIVMVAVDLAKNVISGRDDDMKKNVSVAIKRVMMAVVIFFIPTIVGFANGLVNDAVVLGFDYNECLANANSDDIKTYEEEEYNEKLKEELNRKPVIVDDIDTNNPYAPVGGLGVNPLPDDDKYYPLNGKDMDGNQTEILKIDGKYLTDAEMDELDKYIKDSMDAAGDNWKTRIAAAAYALIFGLNEKGLRLIYEYSGGSGSLYRTECSYGTFCKQWGVKHDETVCWSGCYHNTYRGLDCAGFVRFAVSAGCGVTFDYSDSSYSRSTDYSKLEPGDILLTDGHVMMFMKMSSDGQYIIAESTRSNDYGTVFTKKKSLSNYKIVKLDDVYSKKCVKKN